MEERACSRDTWHPNPGSGHHQIEREKVIRRCDVDQEMRQRIATGPLLYAGGWLDVVVERMLACRA
jgi:hypothetical protein